MHRLPDAEAVDGSTVYVAPSYNNVVGLMVFATGDGAAFERGADDPPVPGRCCAICNDEHYDFNDTRLYADLFRQTALACVSFALVFLTDTALNGWYCVFHATNQTTSFVDAGYGTRASHVYYVA